METIPLTLDVHRLSPYNLIPASESPAQDVPQEAIPVPPPPPSFSLSPTHNYPSPFGSMSLGETFSTHLTLSNTSSSRSPVSGVRMMAEIQSPSNRYRLGEVVHETGRDVGDDEDPDKLSLLDHGESVELDVETEMKELGQHILICSVAWETPDGRRTFQRFLKFNVHAPLNIKTRPYTSPSPNTTLHPTRRNEIYLEVLTQNVSPNGMMFDRVTLEPVQGLESRTVSIEDESTLLPQDTRQFLFVISPTHTSTFPPTYAPGSVLPLGRLDVTWFSGPYREKGRLQTSTLNRRIPQRPPPPSSAIEFDLVVVNLERSIPLEEEFTMTLRLGVRGVSEKPVPIAVQYLTPDKASSSEVLPRLDAPVVNVSGPSRSSTPLDRVNNPSVPSRSTTPLQLSRAPSQSLPPPPPQSPSPSSSTFPPPPTLPHRPTKNTGLIQHLNSSYTALDPEPFLLTPEDLGTTYNETDEDAPQRWETSYEFSWRFLALQEGLAEFGGLRVLVLDDKTIGREWESLGDVWVQG